MRQGWGHCYSNPEKISITYYRALEKHNTLTLQFSNNYLLPNKQANKKSNKYFN